MKDAAQIDGDVPDASDRPTRAQIDAEVLLSVVESALQTHRGHPPGPDADGKAH